MTKKKTPAAVTATDKSPGSSVATDAAAADAVATDANTEFTPSQPDVEETPFEALASICSVLVVGLFILTFLAQNFVIPSGSMEDTLLVGDHLVVDRITLAPPAKWMPLTHYREPKRGDIVVFIKPVPDPDPQTGRPEYLFLVKRLIGVPGDHIHLHDGIVYINGVAQPQPKDGREMNSNPGEGVYLDEFPTITPALDPSATEEWAVEAPKNISGGELVVPEGKYFMMGDNRHNSLDSRYWGFVPRENIVGRPLFNYWSFKTDEAQYEQTGISNTVSWMAHVALHFFTDTRWARTLHVVR
jgi:signal peptidase I